MGLHLKEQNRIWENSLRKFTWVVFGQETFDRLEMSRDDHERATNTPAVKKKQFF